MTIMNASIVMPIDILKQTYIPGTHQWPTYPTILTSRDSHTWILPVCIVSSVGIAENLQPNVCRLPFKYLSTRYLMSRFY